jgi:hypothetical protein
MRRAHIAGGLMEPVSRRSFFKQAGAAAAIAGAASVAPVGIANALAGTTPMPGLSEPGLTAFEGLNEGENLVAHVNNPKTGEITLFIGTREVLIHDRAIAARLLRATR